MAATSAKMGIQLARKDVSTSNLSDGAMEAQAGWGSWLIIWM